MNRARFFVVFAVLLLCAGMAQANPIIDPVIIVRGGSGSIDLNALGTINLTFPGQPGCHSGTFSSGPYVGLQFMDCTFKNQTSLSIYSLTFNINTAQLPLTLQCALLCSSFSNTPSGGTAVFSFNPPIPGVPASLFFREFEVSFIGFAQGTTLAATFATPEPGSLALLGTGLLAIAGRLRKSKKRV